MNWLKISYDKARAGRQSTGSGFRIGRGTTKKWWIGLMALSLVLVATQVAWAAPSTSEARAARRPMVLFGRVAAINNNTIIMHTARGEVAVVADNQTRFRIPNVAEPTLADVRVGDRLAVRGQRMARGALRARLIIVIPKDARLLRGTVEAVSDPSFTLASGGDEVTVLTDEKTRFFIPGVVDAHLENLAVGSHVAVAGLEDDEGYVLARAIRVLPRRSRALVLGKVTALSSDGFRLETRRGEIVVKVDDDTRFRFPGVEDPTLETLKIGQIVGVAGRWNPDGSLQARIIVGRPRRP